ncbi:MAG: hypothetical protein JWL79_1877 [Frankiales bacterium]|nr:hypothetical protein [Frankiales bacterium]
MPRPTAPPPLRDVQRSRVYAAEDAWGLRLDAARRGAVQASIAGSSVVLPAELQFGTLEAADDYCRRALEPWAVPAVALRERRGHGRAHWEAPGTIALPVPAHGTPWALREAVLLHELGHHLAFHLDGSALHGSAFTGRMLELVEAQLGAEAALALRVEYGEHRCV